MSRSPSSSPSSSPTSGSCERLDDWLYAELVHAEKHSHCFLLADLLTCLEKEVPQAYKPCLKRRHKGTDNHPWLMIKARAEEARRLHDLATKRKGDDRQQITADRSNPDLDIDTFYSPTEHTGEMRYICQAHMRNATVLPLSVLIAEVEKYTDWMPVIGASKIMSSHRTGYSCQIVFESPFPKIVNSRDIAMELKVDQDFYRPAVPACFAKQVNPYLSEARQGFQMWTESTANDPLLVEQIGAYNSLLNTNASESTTQFPNCTRAYLRHGSAFIKCTQDENGSPCVTVTLVATVNVWLPRPPKWLVKFVGGKIFQQIVSELVAKSKEVSRARTGEKNEWEYAPVFAGAIKDGQLYQWMQSVIPSSLKSHK